MCLTDLATQCKLVVQEAQRRLGPKLCGYSMLDLVADRIPNASLSDLSAALAISGVQPPYRPRPTPYALVEDNGGGLMLFVFGLRGRPIYVGCGYEHREQELRDALAALAAGDDTSSWEYDPDLDPQARWDALDLRSHSWRIIATEHGAIAVDKMGVAGRRIFAPRGTLRPR